MCCACGGGSTRDPEEPEVFTGVCVDTNIGPNGETISDDWNDDCDDYAANPGWCGAYNNDDFSSETMCCACGGGDRTEQVVFDCQCECQDSHDLDCWYDCWACLDVLLGADE